MTVNNDIKIERCTVMKKITAKQYAKIRPLLPVQRGNVRISTSDFINAVLYVLENGCKRRAQPERFGNWSAVYARFRRWSRSGVQTARSGALRSAVRRASGTACARRGRGLLRPRQRQRRGASGRHRGAEDERAAEHRQIARRLEHEDPHGLGK